jgi:hypothetical protein
VQQTQAVSLSVRSDESHPKRKIKNFLLLRFVLQQTEAFRKTGDIKLGSISHKDVLNVPVNHFDTQKKRLIGWLERQRLQHAVSVAEFCLRQMR